MMPPFDEHEDEDARPPAPPAGLAPLARKLSTTFKPKGRMSGGSRSSSRGSGGMTGMDMAAMAAAATDAAAADAAAPRASFVPKKKRKDRASLLSDL